MRSKSSQDNLLESDCLESDNREGEEVNGKDVWLHESDIREGSEIDDEDAEHLSFIESINFEPVKEVKVEKFTPLLTENHKKQLSRALPPPLQHGEWKLLYSLVRDGSAFSTLLGKSRGYQYTILILRTTSGVMLGGFAAQEWKAHQGGFYGTGHSFLFSLPCSKVPEGSSDKTDECVPERYYEFILDNLLNLCAIEVCGDVSPSPAAPELQIYKWTGKNRYIQFCRASDEKLAFGGGGWDGNFGLCLEGDFARGSSGWCETFGNEPLAGEPTFRIEDLELYGISSACF